MPSVGAGEFQGRPTQIDGLEVFPEGDGFAVYQKERGKVHFFNHTAAFVLELCDGRSDAEGIRKIFSDAFDPPDSPDEEVTAILRQFLEEGLIRIT